MIDTQHPPLRGIGVSPGIAVGSALILEGPNTSIFRVPVAPDRVPREISRLKRALAGELELEFVYVDKREYSRSSAAATLVTGTGTNTG